MAGPDAFAPRACRPDCPCGTLAAAVSSGHGRVYVPARVDRGGRDPSQLHDRTVVRRLRFPRHDPVARDGCRGLDGHRGNLHDLRRRVVDASRSRFELKKHSGCPSSRCSTEKQQVPHRPSPAPTEARCTACCSTRHRQSLALRVIVAVNSLPACCGAPGTICPGSVRFLAGRWQRCLVPREEYGAPVCLVRTGREYGRGRCFIVGTPDGSRDPCFCAAGIGTTAPTQRLDFERQCNV